MDHMMQLHGKKKKSKHQSMLQAHKISDLHWKLQN